ncbi:hypothetical protein SBD_0547 [Streptomyces bottropensis ATCC 25435]|uniref:Uncharacterized protein n=1 Tax=Streptomyces bottropensis ATCC 25435 TaxID=1054862 RepID=M3FXQ9_9ACTN|nr:hypothetical protein SBD_0547 [Streptomyces bottropensis ATCC 25435]
MSDDGEQFESAVALRAGAGGRYHQGLGSVLGVQELGVDVDAAEFGMDDGLAVPGVSRSASVGKPRLLTCDNNPRTPARHAT